MKILAAEFSSPQRSVAVIISGADGEPQCLAETIETGERSTNVLGLVESALREAQLDRAQIECLAIGLGPGSYTGIRQAIALAQGWQLARPVKLLGIGSAECIAADARAAGLAGRAIIVIDAQRDEVYLAGYDLIPGAVREVERLRLATLAEAKQLRLQGAAMIGPEVTRWFPEGRITCPRAAMLGQLAAGRTNYISAAQLVPLYVRETRFVKAPPPRFSA